MGGGGTWLVKKGMKIERPLCLGMSFHLPRDGLCCVPRKRNFAECCVLGGEFDTEERTEGGC